MNYLKSVYLSNFESGMQEVYMINFLFPISLEQIVLLIILLFFELRFKNSLIVINVVLL